MREASFFMNRKLELNSLIAEQPTQKDPLMNYKAEHLIYAGVFLLVIGLIIIVGVLSRKLEYALLFATSLSLVLILFFLTA